MSLTSAGARLRHEQVAVPLRRLAHARAGDKGDTCNIAVFAYHPAFYDTMVQSITPESVQQQFAHRLSGPVDRYLLPRLQGMNLVLQHCLDGGVNDSLNLDSHGKSLSFHLLAMEVTIPAELICLLVPAQDRIDGQLLVI